MLLISIISKRPNYLKTSQLTISKRPNYVERSQLTMSKRPTYLKTSHLSQNVPTFWYGELQKVRNVMKFLKGCGKLRKMRKVAGNWKSCGKLRKMAKVAVLQLPQLYCALGGLRWNTVVFGGHCWKTVIFCEILWSSVKYLNTVVFGEIGRSLVKYDGIR